MWNKVPNDKIIEKTRKALEKNGISVFVANTEEEALKKALELIPKGSEVFTSTSVTADTIGLSDAINKSGNYESVRNRSTGETHEEREKARRRNSAPSYTTGSVHAVTQNGEVIIASNTGSQLPMYAFSSANVIWVVGAQKIVKDLDEGMKRLYEYTLKLESERLKKLYGVPSNISKLLIIKREINPKRLNLILIKENIGF